MVVGRSTQATLLRLQHERSPRGKLIQPITSQGPPRRIPKKSPHHVFWCGYSNIFDQFQFNVGTNLFPEVNISKLQNNSSLDPNDILLYSCGPCVMTGKDMTTVFPGKVLTFNGEASVSKCIQPTKDNNIFSVSPVDHGHLKKLQHSPHAYFASMHLQSLAYKWQNKIYYPHLFPRENTRERFLVYAASNCVSYREIAFAKLSRIGRVEYAGHCQGDHRYGNNANIIAAPRAGGGNRKWMQNNLYFTPYRFALVMENDNAPGYITEKILNAFLAGCIPIYYGTEEVFDVFNKDAFIYWDISNPEPSLEKIAFLEKNATAYDEMLNQPILAHGEETIAKHFSWSDQIGGGMLKWEIREMLGYG